MNQKLSKLENNIVGLHQDVERLRSSGTFSLPFLRMFEELLEIINTIRIENCFVDKKEGEKEKTFNIVIPCESESIDKVIKKLNESGINYYIFEQIGDLITHY